MRGLSFSGPMVVAWLEGNKSITRRLMNPQPDIVVGDQLQADVWYAADFGDAGGDPDRELLPRYNPGETIYIKEKWRIYEDGADSSIKIQYASDLTICLWIHPWKRIFNRYINQKNPYRWRSPMMMPEWASRSHALIKSVRPERIKEITIEESMKEGFTLPLVCGFIPLWESLHPGSWDRNDWIWRYELEKLKEAV